MTDRKSVDREFLSGFCHQLSTVIVLLTGDEPVLILIRIVFIILVCDIHSVIIMICAVRSCEIGDRNSIVFHCRRCFGVCGIGNRLFDIIGFDRFNIINGCCMNGNTRCKLSVFSQEHIRPFVRIGCVSGELYIILTVSSIRKGRLYRYFAVCCFTDF